jgi:hypothetical protein
VEVVRQLARLFGEDKRADEGAAPEESWRSFECLWLHQPAMFFGQ